MTDRACRACGEQQADEWVGYPILVCETPGCPLNPYERSSRPAEANPDGTSQPGPTVSRKRGADPRVPVGPES